jgi:hypothetical protein
MQPGEGGTPPRDPNQQTTQPDPAAEGGSASGESATQPYPVFPQDGGSQQYPSAPGYPPPPQPDPGQYWSPPDQGQPEYGQSQYGQGQGQYGQPPYPQAPYAPVPYGQPPYGQSPYGQSPYGPPPYGPGGYGPPPPPKNNTTKILIAAGVALVVIIAAVLLLATRRDNNKASAGNGGNSATTSASTPTSPSGQTTTTTSAGTSSSGTNPAGTSCEPGKKADLAAIDLTVVLGFVQPGSEPSGYFLNVINACAAPDLVPQLKTLYGKQFGIPEGDDKTGGNGQGPAAEYVFKDRDGNTLDLTMTKASDGHYQATKFTYDG